MDLVTEQGKKYEYRFSPQGNFYQRHLMVNIFLSSQKRGLPGQTRQNLALFVAATFNRGQTTARNIVRWETADYITLLFFPSLFVRILPGSNKIFIEYFIRRSEPYPCRVLYLIYY